MVFRMNSVFSFARARARPNRTRLILTPSRPAMTFVPSPRRACHSHKYSFARTFNVRVRVVLGVDFEKLAEDPPSRPPYVDMSHDSELSSCLL
jgi:hypothetical protein